MNFKITYHDNRILKKNMQLNKVESKKYVCVNTGLTFFKFGFQRK